MDLRAPRFFNAQGSQESIPLHLPIRPTYLLALQPPTRQESRLQPSHYIPSDPMGHRPRPLVGYVKRRTAQTHPRAVLRIVLRLARENSPAQAQNSPPSNPRKALRFGAQRSAQPEPKIPGVLGEVLRLKMRRYKQPRAKALG